MYFSLVKRRKSYKSKKSVERLTIEIEAEKRNTQHLEARYVKEIQDAKDKYEEQIRKLESELAAKGQVSEEVINEFKHFFRAACLLGVGVLVIGLCMRSAYQFRQSRVRAKYREILRRNKQLDNYNQKQEKKLSSQKLQIHLVHSTIVETKNKLKDSQLALRRNQEDKAKLTEVHSKLKEAHTRLEEANTELKEANTRLEGAKEGLVHPEYHLAIARIFYAAALILILQVPTERIPPQG